MLWKLILTRSCSPIAQLAALRTVGTGANQNLQRSQYSKQRQQAPQQQQRPKQAPQQQQRPKQEPQQQQHAQCTSTVAVVGLPNAGKSTLSNRLVGHKISGVSSKRNTTINPQLGSFTVANTQVLLYDTPGLVDQPGQGNPLERLRNAWSVAAMADQLLLIVDAERQFRLQEQSLLRLVQQVSHGPPATVAGSWRQPPAVLFLNKQDKLEPAVRSTVLQQLRTQLCGLMEFQQVFEGAAMRGEGVEELKAYLVQQAQPGAWLMPAGQSHAASAGELAVELVREKLYRRLNKDLPYKLHVTLEAASACALLPPQASPEREQEQEANGSRPLYIRVGVHVPSQGKKAIVVGHGGEVIQTYVTEPTQAELTHILRQPVKLVVSVRVKDS